MAKTLLCPYCFKEFKDVEALYQCDSDETDANNNYICRRTTHKGYDAYWKGEDLPVRHTWPQKTGLFSRSPKITGQRCDQCGYSNYHFVCPHCLNRLRPEMVKDGLEIISVIGSPKSGKTNYIVALIDELSRYGYKLDLQVTPAQLHRDGHRDEATDARFKIMRNTLFREHQMLAKTPEGVRDIPLIFHLHQQHTSKDIYLVFYDTAGERFQENLENNARYLRESSGVIVVLDVLSIPKVKEILSSKGLESWTEGSGDIEEILVSLDNLGINDRVTAKPFAFVFSKFDSVIENYQDLDFNAQPFFDGSKLSGSEYLRGEPVNLDKIDAINEVIEQVLEGFESYDGESKGWDAGSVTQFAHKWMSKKNKTLTRNQQDLNDPDNNYKFFGVSAFGTMPNDDLTLDEVRPYRVADPLLWILYKLGKFKIPVTTQNKKK